MIHLERMLKNTVKLFFRVYFFAMKKLDTLILFVFSALAIFVIFQSSALQFDFNFRAFLPNTAGKHRGVSRYGCVGRVKLGLRGVV